MRSIRWCVTDLARPCCRSKLDETGMKSARFFFDFSLLISARMMLSKSKSSALFMLPIEASLLLSFAIDLTDTSAASVMVTIQKCRSISSTPKGQLMASKDRTDEISKQTTLRATGKSSQLPEKDADPHRWRERALSQRSRPPVQTADPTSQPCYISLRFKLIADVASTCNLFHSFIKALISFGKRP